MYRVKVEKECEQVCWYDVDENYFLRYDDVISYLRGIRNVEYISKIIVEFNVTVKEFNNAE